MSNDSFPEIAALKYSSKYPISKYSDLHADVRHVARGNGANSTGVTWQRGDVFLLSRRLIEVNPSYNWSLL